MKFFRRKYLINQDLQLRYSILFIVIAITGNICSVVLFNVFALKELDALLWSTHISVRTTAEVLNPLFLTVNIATFLFITALSILSGIWMIRNASGPLFRMSRDIDRIADGDLSTSVLLREKDEFQYVADALNNMATMLRAEFLSITNKYDDISRMLAAVDQSAREGAVSPEACDSIIKNITDLEAQLSNYKT